MMKAATIICTLCLFLVASPAVAQDDSKQDAPQGEIPNPFDVEDEAGSADMLGGGGMYEEGMGSYGGSGSMGMPGGMSAGVGESYPGMMGSGAAMGGSGMSGMMGGYPADPFSIGLQRLLKQLAGAKSDAEREKLMEYARKAFAERYQQQLDAREQRIAELEERLRALREEQTRRAEAADRIVDLQMKSLDLVAEGLIEPGQFLNVPAQPR